jgi:xanthine dehydrogenase small subunit
MTDRTIRYLSRGRVVEVADVAPTTTLLDHLREHRGLTGTKEGCNEGDCGACTVAIAERGQKGLEWRAVNACIQLLPMVDGKAVVTVEDLEGRGGALHPIQGALAEGHGSQCGFCTPGFVMSLFAHHRQRRSRPVDRAAVNEVLAGNLCRCTGYRPIADAAIASVDMEIPANAAEDERIAGQLRSLERRGGLDYEGGGGRFIAPGTDTAFARVLEKHKDARIIAGATDVGLWVTKELRELPLLVSTTAVRGLARIARSEGFLEIGAAATYTDAMEPLVRAFPELRPMLLRLGSVQVRNAGTIGGNIANGSPIGDTMPALIALGARLVLRRGAKRREMAIEDFFLGYRRTALEPGEFLEKVRVPLLRGGRKLRVYKISKRFDQDISAVLAAFLIRVVDGRVAEIRIGLGGVAAIPARARAAEAAITGRPWTPATVAAGKAALQSQFSPIDDMRASAAYRRLVLGNLLEKLHVETTSKGTPTRVLEAVV